MAAALLSRASSRTACMSAARPAAASRKPSVRVSALQVTLKTPEGVEKRVQCENGRSLLDGALASGVDVPHLCRTGTCGVCAARVLEGSVERNDFLLDDLQADAGFVLLCTTTPTSDVTVATQQETELHTIPYGL